MSVVWSVVAGIVTAVVTFVLLLLLFISMGLIGWSDGGDMAYLERLERTTTITIVISALTGVVMGIYIAVRISRSKQREIDSFRPGKL